MVGLTVNCGSLGFVDPWDKAMILCSHPSDPKDPRNQTFRTVPLGSDIEGVSLPTLRVT
jgi:hypothetical protein